MLHDSDLAPYVGLFAILLLIGFGLPLPEDLPLLVAGVLVHEETLSSVPAAIAAYAGVLAGDSVIYLFGRRYGRALVALPRVRAILPPERLSTVERYFARYGMSTIVVARFVPGFRSATFLTAGIISLPYPRFLLANGGAALVMVPLWMAIGYYGADHFEAIERGVRTAEHWIFLILIAAVAVFLTVGWLRRRPGAP